MSKADNLLHMVLGERFNLLHFQAGWSGLMYLPWATYCDCGVTMYELKVTRYPTIDLRKSVRPIQLVHSVP